ncbi:hypothetical protein AB0A95_30930 [Micromonospora sp. NPDC049230]|uniref:hypothetical protein n=1 Tax=Micromonospora sp. NPDC049230 TaxID=3155502 RepID=UPI003405A257
MTYRPSPYQRHVRILRAELAALAELAGKSGADPATTLAQIRDRAAEAATSEWMRQRRREDREREARMVWDPDGKVWRDPCPSDPERQ